MLSKAWRFGIEDLEDLDQICIVHYCIGSAGSKVWEESIVLAICIFIAQKLHQARASFNRRSLDRRRVITVASCSPPHGFESGTKSVSRLYLSDYSTRPARFLHGFIQGRRRFELLVS